jgi:antirestriction protein ArdC
MKKTTDFVLDAILKALDEGVAPWQKTWKGSHGLPKNLSTGKAYRGMNLLLLGLTGFSSPYWLTFKQAKALGGQVRGGESATPIIFWKPIEKDTVKADGSTGVEKFMLRRHYNVFNLDQIDGIEAPEAPEGGCDFEPIEEAAAIWEGWEGRPTLNHGGGRAYYRPSTDSIQMPKAEAFVSPEAYYATLFHEMAHATGAEKRLKRSGVTDGALFGSHKYGVEELVAEMTSAFLCSATGIEGTFDNSIAYIASWKKTIREEGASIVLRAAGCAQKAFDLLHKSREAVAV